MRPRVSMHRASAGYVRGSLPIDTFNEENWPEMIRWACDSHEAIESAVAPRLMSLNVRMQSGEVPI